MDFDILDKRLRVSLWLLFGFAISAVIAYFVWFGAINNVPASLTADAWGEFGDFVGGVMNPLVAACALYWLTMSVRLQKQELAAARAELQLTRNELAAASSAQREQARLALLSTRINSLNMRLSTTTAELEYIRGRLGYVLQRMDDKGPHTMINDVAVGKTIPAHSVANGFEEKMDFLYKREGEIMKELERIDGLINAEMT